MSILKGYSVITVVNASTSENGEFTAEINEQTNRIRTETNRICRIPNRIRNKTNKTFSLLHNISAPGHCVLYIHIPKTDTI